MAIGNDIAHWGRVSRALHWGMAALLVLEVPAGFVMGRTYAAKDPTLARWHYWSANVHHSLGLTLLALVILRAAWRLSRLAPGVIGTRAERRVARGVQGLLYAFLLLVPLAGWAALSSLMPTAQFPNPLWFFGHDGFAPGGWVPHIVPPVAWDAPTFWRYGTFITAHRWLLIGGAVLLSLHVLAALRHHFILRDATLRRMLKDDR